MFSSLVSSCRAASQSLLGRRRHRLLVCVHKACAFGDSVGTRVIIFHPSTTFSTLLTTRICNPVVRTSWLLFSRRRLLRWRRWRWLCKELITHRGHLKVHRFSNLTITTGWTLTRSTTKILDTLLLVQSSQSAETKTLGWNADYIMRNNNCKLKRREFQWIIGESEAMERSRTDILWIKWGQITRQVLWTVE